MAFVLLLYRDLFQVRLSLMLLLNRELDLMFQLFDLLHYQLYIIRFIYNNCYHIETNGNIIDIIHVSLL